MYFLPRLTLKQLMWIFILTLLSMFLHIWYMNRMAGFVGDFSRLMSEASNMFLQDDAPPPLHTKHVLFWNGYQGNMIDQTIQCTPPGDSCIYKAKSKNKEVDDVFFYAIIFNERSFNWSDIPKKRWENQLYIFWCIEPSLTAPDCQPYNDSFFNWTFTYRLDSTVPWNYFLVQERDTNVIVAPNKSVIWRDNDEPLKPYLKNVLSKKTTAIAWVTSNCKMNHKGSMYMYDLQEQLKHLDLFIDVYGPCSNSSCTNNDCDKMVKKDYHFYIAFEDYLAEDFVSSKVLEAYNNFAVPIVYGGADYRWFLPPGSYLDAKEMQPHSLAFAVKRAIDHPEVYASYFQWHNIYSIGGYLEGRHPLCALCAAMNDNMKYYMNEKHVVNRGRYEYELI